MSWLLVVILGLGTNSPSHASESSNTAQEAGAVTDERQGDEGPEVVVMVKKVRWLRALENIETGEYIPTEQGLKTVTASMKPKPGFMFLQTMFTLDGDLKDLVLTRSDVVLRGAEQVDLVDVHWPTPHLKNSDRVTLVGTMSLFRGMQLVATFAVPAKTSVDALSLCVFVSCEKLGSHMVKAE